MLLYLDSEAENSPTMRLMNYTLKQLPGYNLKSYQAPMKRTVAMLTRSQQSQIFCNFGLFSTSESHALSQARWSKVVAINPDSWTFVYNKASSNKVKKYMDADGYFDESFEKIKFNVEDLPEKFYVIFRDPELRGGYAYDFSDRVPADIVAKTLQIRSPNSMEQVLRMVERGRLDITAIDSRRVYEASRRFGFKNVAAINYRFDTRRFEHPFRHYGLICSRNDLSNEFLDKFNSMIEQVRGESDFVRMLMDEYYAPNLIEQSMRVSDQLKAGAYDLSRIEYSSACALHKTVVDQTQNGGQWQRLATVTDPLSLTVRGDGYGFTVADAARFERLDKQDKVIQTFDYSYRDKSFSHKGFGLLATAATASFSQSYRFDATPSASHGRWAKWAPQGLPAGRYRISLWWPSYDKHRPFPADVPVDIAHGKGCTEQVVDYD